MSNNNNTTTNNKNDSHSSKYDIYQGALNPKPNQEPIKSFEDM